MKLQRTRIILIVTGFAAYGALHTSASDTNAPLREGPRVMAAADLGIGRLAPDVEIEPVSGKKFRLSVFKGAPAVAIAFTSTSCPVTKRYLPTLAALEKEFSARGVKFVFVNPIATDSAGDVTAAISSAGLTGPYMRDTKGRIRDAFGARSTAEVFVLDAARTVVYRGAIDDQYGIGYSRNAARERYLIDAIESVLGGNPPSVQATTAPGCALEPTEQKAGSVPLTYHARISRIVQQHCLGCHRTEGVAPFALETYEDVVSHAGMLRKQVDKGAMPPWFAAPMAAEPHRWANDRTLPADDKAALFAWLASGRKEGDAADAPLARTFPKDWELGSPDAIVRIPEPMEVKATGTMPYQNVFVETTFGEDKWVRAMEVRPTAREVVHHALVYVVPADKVERARKRGGDTDGGNFFAVYVPGNNVLRFGDGFGKLIPKGATLHFQIHYTPNGTATRDQTAVALIFASEAPRHEVRVAAIPARLDIPPGDPNYEARGRLPVPFDAKLMSFMPHMHVRGKAYRYELQLPGGESKLLLDVPRYDFNWQLQYRLAEFLDAPAGSTLLGTAWYDNSTNNPANPDPTQRVKWGPQTDDEMMLGYLEYYLPNVQATAKKTSIAELVMRDGGFVFSGLDKNQDGIITRDESPSAQQFQTADANGDGSVTREEFRSYWQQRNKRQSDTKQ